MAKILLAEALLRRKELSAKVVVLSQIKSEAWFDVRVKRVNVADGIDEVTALVPKLSAGELTQEFDYHARQLRLVDAAIQQANWTTEIEVNDIVMKDFVPKEEEKKD